VNKQQLAEKLLDQGIIKNINEIEYLFYKEKNKPKEIIGYAHNCNCSNNCEFDYRYDLQGNLFEGE